MSRKRGTSKPISGLQCKVARAAMSISRDDLQELTGVGSQTIARFENTDIIAKEAARSAIRAGLERLGVEFGRPRFAEVSWNAMAPLIKRKVAA